MEVVLFCPEIPQNTGNIARTCAVTGANLTLIPPLGFSLASRHLKRAGLDYWKDVQPRTLDSLEELLEETESSFYFFSSKAQPLYTEIPYKEDDRLIFGSETKGLPQEMWDRYPDRFYTLPMRPQQRSLNLSNTVAIVLYEAWKTCGFISIGCSIPDHTNG